MNGTTITGIILLILALISLIIALVSFFVSTLSNQSWQDNKTTIGWWLILVVGFLVIVGGLALYVGIQQDK